jgi:hypothetical protein
MRKGIASLGLVLVVVAAFLFYIVFAGGSLFGLTVTGSSAIANSIAFLFVIIALPIGAGLSCFGLVFKVPAYGSLPSPQPTRPIASGGRADLISILIPVIAVIIAVIAIIVVVEVL